MGDYTILEDIIQQITKIKQNDFKVNLEELRRRGSDSLDALFPNADETTLINIFDTIRKASYSYRPDNDDGRYWEAGFRLALLGRINERIHNNSYVEKEANELARYFSEEAEEAKHTNYGCSDRNHILTKLLDSLELANAQKNKFLELGNMLFDEGECSWRNALRCYKLASSDADIKKIGVAYLEMGEAQEAYTIFSEIQPDDPEWQLFEKELQQNLVITGTPTGRWSREFAFAEKYFSDKKDKNSTKRVIINWANNSNGNIGYKSIENFENQTPTDDEFRELADALLSNIVISEKVIELYRKSSTSPTKEPYKTKIKQHIKNGQVLSGVARYMVAFPQANEELLPVFYEGIVNSHCCSVSDIKDINKILSSIDVQIPESVLYKRIDRLLYEPFNLDEVINLCINFELIPDTDKISHRIKKDLAYYDKNKNDSFAQRVKDSVIRAYEFMTH